MVEYAFRNVKESDHTEHLLVGRLRKSDAFIPELSLVAEVDEMGWTIRSYGLEK